MSLTITFPSDLAERLLSEAKQRQMSVEELAAALLDRAVPRTGDWSDQNHRRLALIRKSVRESLTPAEQQELDALQATLAARFDDFDAALQSQLDSMRSVVQ